ncbi:MAG: hypothetical protein CMH57_04245, partial [Myxococcales bacterium]|nr:hypothetical protein [Myxococcales bacterium]
MGLPSFQEASDAAAEDASSRSGVSMGPRRGRRSTSSGERLRPTTPTLPRRGGMGSGAGDGRWNTVQSRRPYVGQTDDQPRVRGDRPARTSTQFSFGPQPEAPGRAPTSDSAQARNSNDSSFGRGRASGSDAFRRRDPNESSFGRGRRATSGDSSSFGRSRATGSGSFGRRDPSESSLGRRDPNESSFGRGRRVTSGDSSSFGRSRATGSGSFGWRDPSESSFGRGRRRSAASSASNPRPQRPKRQTLPLRFGDEPDEQPSSRLRRMPDPTTAGDGRHTAFSFPAVDPAQSPSDAGQVRHSERSVRPDRSKTSVGIGWGHDEPRDRNITQPMPKMRSASNVPARNPSLARSEAGESRSSSGEGAAPPSGLFRVPNRSTRSQSGRPQGGSARSSLQSNRRTLMGMRSHDNLPVYRPEDEARDQPATARRGRRSGEVRRPEGDAREQAATVRRGRRSGESHRPPAARSSSRTPARPRGAEPSSLRSTHIGLPVMPGPAPEGQAPRGRERPSSPDPRSRTRPPNPRGRTPSSGPGLQPVTQSKPDLQRVAETPSRSGSLSGDEDLFNNSSSASFAEGEDLLGDNFDLELAGALEDALSRSMVASVTDEPDSIDSRNPDLATSAEEGRAPLSGITRNPKIPGRSPDLAVSTLGESEDARPAAPLSGITRARKARRNFKSTTGSLKSATGELLEPPRPSRR